MQFKSASFLNLISDPDHLKIEPEDFMDIIQSTGFIDESDEALSLMSDEDLAAFEQFEKDFC